MPRPLAALAVVLALVAAACGDDADDSASPTSAPTETTETTEMVTAEPADFSGRGSYAVGQVDLETADGVRLAVFYPVDADAVGDDATAYTYSGEDVLDPDVAAILPGALSGEVAPADTWVEVPASDDGPFPLVLHSHGFSGNLRFGNHHNAAVASWGYVVAAVDHPERGLASILEGFLGGEPADRGDERLDTQQLLDALDHLTDPDAVAATPLADLVDAERIAVEGHSAGGSASGTAAYDDRVDLWIGQAPALPLPAEGDLDDLRGEDGRLDSTAVLAGTEPFETPSLVITAEGDAITTLDGVRQIFDWLDGPKRLAVLADSGHAVFIDPCEPIRESGGLSPFVEALGLDPAEVPLVALGEDGCLPDDTDPEAVWGLIDHLTVAQLHLTFGTEAEVAAASLEADHLEATFPGLLRELVVE